MEGADSLIAYLEVEEKDAQETKKKVEEYGQTCHLIQVDLKKKEDCHKVVDTAIEKMGAINILVNNAAYQNMINDINDLTEEQWEFTFNTNIHPVRMLRLFDIAEFANTTCSTSTWPSMRSHT